MISVVIACRKPEDANHAFSALKSVGTEFQAIPVCGTSSILDAYSIGQGLAKSDIVLYTHQDAMCFQGALEAGVRALFDRHKNLGFVGVAGSKIPIACGLFWHAEKETVGNEIVGERGKEAALFTGWILRWPNTPWGAVNAAQPAKLLDGNVLITNRKDWEFRPTDLTSFLGMYDSDISFEALDRSRDLMVAPFFFAHFSRVGVNEHLEEKALEQFGKTDFVAHRNRWRHLTVPCEIPECPTALLHA